MAHILRHFCQGPRHLDVREVLDQVDAFTLTPRLVLDVQGKEDLRNLHLPRCHHLRLQLRRNSLQQKADQFAFRAWPHSRRRIIVRAQPQPLKRICRQPHRVGISHALQTAIGWPADSTQPQPALA